MSKYSLTHLSDRTLDHELPVIAAREAGATATFIAWLGEFDERRRYVPAGYPSMTAYCRGKLGLHEQAALKRLRVARAARRFPLLFEALADRRLDLSGALLLVPSLRDETVTELVAAAAHKTNVEIEWMLRERSQPELAAAVSAVAATELSVQTVVAAQEEPAPVLVGQAPPTPIAAPRPQRVDVRITISLSAYEDLRWALAESGMGLSRAGEVVERLLCAYVRRRKGRKLGTTDRPRRCARTSQNPRRVPPEVRGAVHRCEACARLELDHIVPVARGGESTIENLRLRCHAHNQYAAEQIYGREFMEAKREETRAAKPQPDPDHDVTPWLRSLGVRPADAKRAQEHVASMTDATLEERVKAALAFVAPPHTKIAAG